jgi:hypothetical protein
MRSREAILTVCLVGAVLVTVLVGLLVGFGARRAPDAEGSPVAGPSDAPAVLLRSLEQRVARLEGALASMQSGENSARAAGGGGIWMRDGSVLADLEDGGSGSSGGEASRSDAAAPSDLLDGGWLEREDVRESLREAIAEEQSRWNEEQETEAAERRRVERGETRDGHLDAAALAAGLSPYERDGVSEILAGAREQQLDLEERAADLLLAPGAITDETRASYQSLRDERKAILEARDDELRRLVGEDKLKALRQYERDQQRKLDLYYSLTDWMPSRPQPRKSEGAPKKQGSRRSGNKK